MWGGPGAARFLVQAESHNQGKAKIKVSSQQDQNQRLALTEGFHHTLVAG